MKNIRYDSEPTVVLIKKVLKVIEGEDGTFLINSIEKNELALKILLRKVKLKLKKERTDSDLKKSLLKYREYIKEYMDIIDDINLILEDKTDLLELEDKVKIIEDINSNLINTDLELQKFVIKPEDVTAKLLKRLKAPPKKKDPKLRKPKLNPKKDELDSYSSLEILKITLPPKPRKKLPEEQYKSLDKKLKHQGLSLPPDELRKIAECGFDQRINMSVLSRIFDTLEEVISNYGENFRERMKTILLFIASNYLFIYDLSKFYTNFADQRIGLMEKIVPTMNTGLSITEYLSAIMKVVEILQIEENELAGDAKITEDIDLSYMEWIKINEYEINLRYEIRDYWQNWFDNIEVAQELDDDDYEMVDEDVEVLMEKLTFLELKIERLPYALESPWELSSWLKELFTIMREHSLELNQWSKIKKAELIMGTLNFCEQTFIDPNIYTTVRGPALLLKLGRRIEFIKDKILGSLRDTIDTINNYWQNYTFQQPINYMDTSILEKNLIGLTLAQTAIDQIELFFQHKNILDLVFATQLLSIAAKLYSLDLVNRPILLENEKVINFIYSFINFHGGRINQEEFQKSTEWLPELINSLVSKRNYIKKMKEEGSKTNIIEVFIKKILADCTQGQSDLKMYQQTQLRLFLLTSIFSILQGANRLMVLKNLENKYIPGDENYEYFSIISDILANF